MMVLAMFCLNVAHPGYGLQTANKGILTEAEEGSAKEDGPESSKVKSLSN